jgi:hypothetical protein
MPSALARNPFPTLGEFIAAVHNVWLSWDWCRSDTRGSINGDSVWVPGADRDGCFE